MTGGDKTEQMPRDATDQETGISKNELSESRKLELTEDKS